MISRGSRPWLMLSVHHFLTIPVLHQRTLPESWSLGRSWRRRIVESRTLDVGIKKIRALRPIHSNLSGVESKVIDQSLNS
jgi:hypothetical protein